VSTYTDVRMKIKRGYNITYFDVAPITSKYKNNLIVGWQVGAIWSDLSVYELMDTKLVDL
jgi:hypothetical protein